VLDARALIRLGRGDLEGALADQAEALAAARVAKDPQALHPALLTSAFVSADAGHLAEAGLLFDELISQGANAFNHADHAIGDVIWLADVLDRRDEARRALATAQQQAWLAAGRAQLDEDYVRAVEIFEAGHALRSAASTRLRAAEALAAAGRRAEADEQLRPALAFFRSVGATRWTRAGEALLAATA
jgi:tetratricopeptide (TPR) repeat protein